jgi:hypothetical protein
MITIYQTFKMIFGLIISVFVLYFTIYYVGVYTGIQEDAQKGLILKNFIKTSNDVYLTGNSIGFDDLRRHEFHISLDTSEPEGIVSSTGKTLLSFPLFLSYDSKSVFIERNSLDMGWWEFYFVETMPETRILFNPLTENQDAWNLMREITAKLPDTGFFKPKVTFGFCDGVKITENLCFGNLCEREDFLYHMEGMEEKYSKCEAPLTGKHKLITVSPSCSGNLEKGVCVEPPTPMGIGNFYIAGHDDALIYKDPVDIVSAIIGGEKDIYGNSGETMYRYKNNMFRKQIKFASDIMFKRSILVGGEFPVGSECQSLYSDFSNSMNTLSSLLSDESYYETYGKVTSLVTALKDSREKYQELVDGGCDYP